MGPPFCKHCHEHIASIIKYFERERNNMGPLLALEKVRQRAADALGIHISSVSKVSRLVVSGEPLAGPSKPHRSKTVTNIDENQAAEVRNLIYEMHADKKQVTVQTLNSKIRELQLFEMSNSSLSRVLHRIGFRFKRDDNRRVLMELPHIALLRINFLRVYMDNLRANDPREVVFLGETWIFENGTTTTPPWQDASSKSVRRLKVDGKRHIVLHAGGRKGFIEGANLIFASKTNSADYHGEMNEGNFLKWFEEQLLPSLEEPSLIIMDNANYHSTLVEKAPTASTQKAEMQQWLREHNIPFDEKLLKPELLDLINRNKPPKRYKADEMALLHGHEVLRLPPYHRIFNPIEMIWGLTKTYYSKPMGRDSTGRERSLEMWQEALDQITPQIWNYCVNHTDKVIEYWWTRESLMDREEVAPLIINLEDDSDNDLDPFGGDTEEED